MKRRFVLHLGLWKTGTTTIQSFLRHNPDFLADLGVHYPKVRPENPDHPFFRRKPPTAFLAEEVSHQFLGRELAQGKLRTSPDLPLWSTAFRQIEESSAHTGIISYENFSAQIPRYDFGTIAGQLKSFDVIGIIYLRPQESWAVSLYSQFIRGARTSLPFREFVAGIRHRLTYSTLLDRIRAHIPLDGMIVRDFDVASKAGLVEDFFRSLDLASPFLSAAPDYDVKNRSLPHWAVLFLLRCAQASFAAEHRNDVRKALMWSAARQHPLPLRPGLDLVAPDERAGLRAVMKADAARLAEKYGIMFAEPEPPPIPYRPFDQDDVDTIKGVIASRLGNDAAAALDDL